MILGPFLGLVSLWCLWQFREILMFDELELTEYLI